MQFQPEIVYDSSVDNEDVSTQLNDGDSAQFAAGILYAVSGQMIPESDLAYIIDCSVQNEHLDHDLTRAFYYYSAG